jgi:hypothetical protein
VDARSRSCICLKRERDPNATEIAVTCLLAIFSAVAPPLKIGLVLSSSTASTLPVYKTSTHDMFHPVFGICRNLKRRIRFRTSDKVINQLILLGFGREVAKTECSACDAAAKEPAKGYCIGDLMRCTSCRPIRARFGDHRPGDEGVKDWSG